MINAPLHHRLVSPSRSTNPFPGALDIRQGQGLEATSFVGYAVRQRISIFSLGLCETVIPSPLSSPPHETAKVPLLKNKLPVPDEPCLVQQAEDTHANAQGENSPLHRLSRRTPRSEITQRSGNPQTWFVETRRRVSDWSSPPPWKHLTKNYRTQPFPKQGKPRRYHCKCVWLSVCARVYAQWLAHRGKQNPWISGEEL